MGWQKNFPQKREKRLPEFLTDKELQAFYEAVFSASNRTHMVMIKLLIFTGVRNAELANIRLTDVDLQSLRIRIECGKGKKDRYVPIPKSFRGELAQYIENQRKKKETYLFESNRLKPYSTRRIRQIVRYFSTIKFRFFWGRRERRGAKNAEKKKAKGHFPLRPLLLCALCVQVQSVLIRG